MKKLESREFCKGPKDGLEAWNLSVPYVRFDIDEINRYPDEDTNYHVYKRDKCTGDYNYMGVMFNKDYNALVGEKK